MKALQTKLVTIARMMRREKKRGRNDQHQGIIVETTDRHYRHTNEQADIIDRPTGRLLQTDTTDGYTGQQGYYEQSYGNDVRGT